MISKSALHAVSALLALADLPETAYLGTPDLAGRIGAPRNYLGKLLQALAEHGLLDSQKGKGGGFRLARRPENISLFDIVEPIDHVSRWQGCFFDRFQCSGESPCPAHHRWSGVRNAYFQFLNKTTLAHLQPHDVSDASHC